MLLGKQGVTQTQPPLRLVGYTVEGKSYWIATDRFDLTAEQIALIYKLRWDIETVQPQLEMDIPAVCIKGVQGAVLFPLGLIDP